MSNTEKIRVLNDELRTRFTGGRIATTPGVLALRDLPTILKQLQEFAEFEPGNDPHHEHDFGTFWHEGQLLYWKIDYYDPDLMMGSSDPAEPALTTRILTIMLAAEY